MRMSLFNYLSVFINSLAPVSMTAAMPVTFIALICARATRDKLSKRRTTARTWWATTKTAPVN